MESANEMKLIFESRSINESFARVTVAAFMTSLNPTVEEVSDVKTAVSEAVTNAIIHGYEGEVHSICIRCRIEGKTLYVEVEDEGKGIEDVKQILHFHTPIVEPLYNTPDKSGIFFYQPRPCFFIPFVRFLNQYDCMVHNFRPSPIVFLIFTKVPTCGLDITSNSSIKASIKENPIPDLSCSGFVVNNGSMACFTSSIPFPSSSTSTYK